MLFNSLLGMARSVRAFIYGQKTFAFPVALDALTSCSLRMPKPLCPLASAPPGTQMWGASGLGSPVLCILWLQSWQREPRAVPSSPCTVLRQHHRPMGAMWGTDATKNKRTEGLTQRLLRCSQKWLGNVCFEDSKMQFLPNRERDKTIQTMYRI